MSSNHLSHETIRMQMNTCKFSGQMFKLVRGCRQYLPGIPLSAIVHEYWQYFPGIPLTGICCNLATADNDIDISLLTVCHCRTAHGRVGGRDSLFHWFPSWYHCRHFVLLITCRVPVHVLCFTYDCQEISCFTDDCGYHVCGYQIRTTQGQANGNSLFHFTVRVLLSVRVLLLAWCFTGECVGTTAGMMFHWWLCRYHYTCMMFHWWCGGKIAGMMLHWWLCGHHCWHDVSLMTVRAPLLARYFTDDCWYQCRHDVSLMTRGTTAGMMFH